MPGWLVRSDHIRSVELVAEFLRMTVRAATAEEAFQHGCETFRQLFDADAGLLWKLDSTGHRLEVLAGSPPEWRSSGEVVLEAFPHWQDALAGDAALWVEEVATRWQPLPPPLLEAHSALVVPVVTHGEAYGCLLGVFGKGVAAPSPEELEAGQALAHGLGLMLEADTLREQLEAMRRQGNTRRRIERELHRRGLSESGLNSLAAVVLELSQAEATGLYERQPTAFRRLVAAGATHLLPAELPLSDSQGFPWERARAEAPPLEVTPAELTHVLKPWLPQLARTGLRLRVLPLKTAEGPLGVLLVCGFASAEVRGAESDEVDWTGLSLLATAALETRRRRRLEERHQLRYRHLFDHMHDWAFLLDRAGRLRAANPRLLGWIGYTLPELQGHSLAEFLHPGDWEPLSAWLEAGSEHGLHTGVQWRLKSGALWPSDLVLQAEPEAGAEAEAEAEETLVVGFVRDTSRIREADDRPCVNEARLQGLLDSVHDGVWLIGTDGKVVSGNQRLGQLFGVNPQQLGAGVDQQQAVSGLRKHFRFPETVLMRWEQLNRSPEEVCWDELELVEPRRRILERFSRPLFDARQQLVGRLEVYRDITPQRVLDEKVMQRQRLAAVGQLISGIAHELNNPLTAVTGYAQLLLSSRLPPALQEKAERLAQEADRAGRIVKNLLLFARGAKAEKQSIELPELLDRTLSLRAYELKVENIAVVRACAPQVSPVSADPYQLQQVFLNILLNAEQAIRSQRAHGQITVRIHSRPQDRCARVEISDTGPGIPPAVLPHIFDPFFTTNPPEVGTGLGLSISQAIVKEHGGEIHAQSPPGQGATFIVELPTRPRPAVLPAARRSSARPAKKTPARILVVDDEPAVAQLIADALEQKGYKVHVHTESRRALAEALQEPFGLAICDIRMPELDGQAFHRALREQQPALARRLLFTTGDTLARETADFLEQVRLPYLAKPFRVEQLQTVVRKLLQAWDTSEPGEEATSTN